MDGNSLENELVGNHVVLENELVGNPQFTFLKSVGKRHAPLEKLAKEIYADEHGRYCVTYNDGHVLCEFNVFFMVSVTWKKIWSMCAWRVSGETGRSTFVRLFTVLC